MSKGAEPSALKHMQSIIAQRPVTIAVQTYDACNSACVFCARTKIKPTKKLMSLDLFEKVCKDYSEIGGGHMGFSPLMADPLIDPLFIERIQILKKYLNITPNVFTNGIALVKFSDDEILKLLDSVHHIDISIGGFGKSAYKTMYGVDKFDIVWSQLKRLSKLNSGKKILKLHVRTNSLNVTSKSTVLEEARKLGYVCTDITNTFSSWNGLITEKDLPDGAKIAQVDNSGKKIECFSPMYNFMIMQEGKAIACGCMDAMEHFEIGDVNKQSIIEIWTSPEMQSIRDSFRKGDMPKICRTCTYYTPYESYYSNKGLVDFNPSEDFWSSMK